VTKKRVVGLCAFFVPLQLVHFLRDPETLSEFSVNYVALLMNLLSQISAGRRACAEAGCADPARRIDTDLPNPQVRCKLSLRLDLVPYGGF
jgi:hypothetical protein